MSAAQWPAAAALASEVRLVKSAGGQWCWRRLGGAGAMYVTEATTGQQELTVQIDISMPHLSQIDLNAYPGLNNNNNKRFSKRSNSQEKRQTVYKKRYPLEELLEPALLSPSNSQGSGSGGSGTGSHQGKKPFITVVKTGTFLEPPDKMNCYLKNQHGGSQVLVYSYCSRPRVMQPAIKVRSRENLKFNINNNNNSSLNNLNYYQTNNKSILQTNNNNFKNKRSINNNEINRYYNILIYILSSLARQNAQGACQLLNKNLKYNGVNNKHSTLIRSIYL